MASGHGFVFGLLGEILERLLLEKYFTNNAVLFLPTGSERNGPKSLI
jgi:hypothetical protein